MTLRIDCHVHIVGDGSSGSGCRLRLGWLRRQLQARFMLRGLGIEPSVINGGINGGLDRAYATRLHEMLTESSLDAAVVLAHDYPRDDVGAVLEDRTPIYVPNDYVIDLARQHPGFIPAVSIHPRRPDALEELERAIEAGAPVMKCLPNVQNINASDASFTRFWERMAEAGMLLLAHTGDELSLPVLNAAYADPAILRLPLECGVRVIAAHSASSSLYDPGYFARFKSMLGRYPNLFGDNSALNTPFRSRFLRRCLEPAIAERIVHGSDVPIPVSGRWAWWSRLIDRSTFLELERNPNVLERDYQLKRAAGFPDSCFTRLAGLLRQDSPFNGGAAAR